MQPLNLDSIRSGRTDGTFHKHELPGLLVGIAQRRLTGRLLLVTGGDARRTIGFDDGQATLAGSNVPAERLGARMLERGVITAAQGVEIDNIMAAESLKFGDAMVKVGLLTEDKLQRTLKWHQNWLIARCLELPDAESTFDASGMVPSGQEPLGLFKCIEEAIRGYDGDEVLELVRQFEGWRFTVEQDMVDLAYRMGAGNSILQVCEVVKGTPHSFQALIASSEDDHPLVPVLTIVLAGIAGATHEEGAGDVEGTKLEDVDALLATLSSSDRIRTGPIDELPALPADPLAAAAPVDAPSGPLGSNLFEGLDLEQSDRLPALEPVPDLAAPSRSFPLPVEVSPPQSAPPRSAHVAPALRAGRGGLVAAALAFFVLGYGSGMMSLIYFGDTLAGMLPFLAPRVDGGAAATVATPEPPPASEPAPAKAVVAEAQPDGKSDAEAPKDEPAEDGSGKVQAHLEKGHALLNKKRTGLAIEEYKKALALDAKDGTIHRALGIAYTMQGKPDKAIAEYKLYLDMVPDAEDAQQLKQMITAYESQR